MERQRTTHLQNELLVASLVALAGFALYLRTLVPGLLGGDSGEFQTLTYLLGHTHPTGYPVYLFLAHPFQHLPIRDGAYRANAFSALMGGITLGALYLAARTLTRHRGLALTLTIAFALSPTFWSQALIAEVYTPAAAFFTAILALLLHWERTRTTSFLLAAGFLGGWSLGVHMTVALLAPAVLLLLWGKARQPRPWAMAAGAAILGLLMTLALFWWIDARQSPADYFRLVVEPSASAWGLSPQDVDEPWERLRFHWTAQQFRPYMLQFHPLPEQARWYFRHLPQELGWPILGLALWGFVALARHHSLRAAFLGLALLTQWLFTLTYTIWDLYVFLIPGYILIVLLAAAGADALVHRGVILQVPQKGVVLLLVLLLLAGSLQHAPRVRHAITQGGPPSFPFEEYPTYDARLPERVRPLIADLPSGAILLTDWDMLWPYAYIAYVEMDRRDVRFIETRPRDDRPEIADSLIHYIRSHLSDHPVFISTRDRELREKGFRLIPTRVGGARLYKITRRTSE